MKRYVLDSSALLCLIHDEPGSAAVSAVLTTSVVGAVNLAEVVTKLNERGVDDEAIDQILTLLDLTVVPFDQTLARTTGLLRSETRTRGLSLGDRACLALARHLGAPALTTDTAWQDLGDIASIEFAR